MKARFKTAALLLAGTLAVAAGCATEPDDDAVKLIFADGYSPVHPIGKGGAQPFYQHLVEHGPEHGIEVERYAPGQLGKPADILQLLRSDAVQIAPAFPSFLANSIPLSSVAELPNLAPDLCTGINAFMPMVQPGGTLYELEFKEQGLVPLWGVMMPGYQAYTSDTEITSPTDLRGKLIRSPGGVADRVITSLGASPVFISTGDVYEAMSRGTVDGTMFAPYTVPSYGLEDVTSYASGDVNLTSTTILFSVSLDQWEALSDDQRDLLVEAGEIAQAGACESQLSANAPAEETMREEGVHIPAPESIDNAEWDAALSTVRADWIRDLESVGLPAGDVLAEYEARLAEEQK